MMIIFSNPFITIATQNDIPAIGHLLNISYRGETSKQGWTTEAHLVAGEQRTNKETVLQTMLQPGSIFLLYTGEQQNIIGCVNLQEHGEKLYLGMFGVAPQLQGAGIGKQLLQAAEEYAKYKHCKAIYMSVISVREELISWYKRHGYEDTLERKEFAEDGIHGEHLQPMEFMILEKTMN